MDGGNESAQLSGLAIAVSADSMATWFTVFAQLDGSCSTSVSRTPATGSTQSFVIRATTDRGHGAAEIGQMEQMRNVV